jgi:hypothetical protein
MLHIQSSKQAAATDDSNTYRQLKTAITLSSLCASNWMTDNYQLKVRLPNQLARPGKHYTANGCWQCHLLPHGCQADMPSFASRPIQVTNDVDNFLQCIRTLPAPPGWQQARLNLQPSADSVKPTCSHAKHSHAHDVSPHSSAPCTTITRLKQGMLILLILLVSKEP